MNQGIRMNLENNRNCLGEYILFIIHEKRNLVKESDMKNSNVRIPFANQHYATPTTFIICQCQKPFE